MDLVERLRAILTRYFPPPDRVSLEDDDGIIGSVVSSQFEDVEMMDRINMIWDRLDPVLTPEERRRVVLIVAATPEEEAAYSE
jgi:hypothetical protein